MTKDERDLTYGAIGNELREELGRAVREEWIAWAREQPDVDLDTLVPWEHLTEAVREVDRRIGERLYTRGRRDGCLHGFWGHP